MKNITVSFIIALFLINTGFSQSKWNFSLSGGYNMPLSDMKGTMPDTIGSSGSINFGAQKTYLLTKGFSVGVTAKYTADTGGSARITGSFIVNSFSQSKDYSRPSGTITISNSMLMISFMGGAEYHIRPKEKVDPFIGLELAYNLFSGKIEGKGDTTFSYSRKSENRIGINVNGGVEIRLKKNISLLLGARYCTDNLFGKKRETTTTTVTDAETNPGGLFNNELPLNDSESGAIQSKSIIHLQFYAGISLGI